jgi:glucose-6-phosphate 1-dehydrogenase
MFDQDGLRGVTANPVIFEKAITGSTASVDDATADTTTTSASRCFCYEDYFDAMPSTGYETPLYDRPQGDATLCERADGVKDCWRILTPVLDVWQALKPREFPNDATGRWDQRQPMTRWPRTVANETSAVSTVAFDASAKR